VSRERTIVVGDVHGCREELERLLDAVGFSGSDRLCFVGDLVARGPDPIGVLAIARDAGALVVRGNHEDKLLSWWRARTAGRPLPALGATHQAVADRLRRDDWAMLRKMPLWADLPDHDLRIVHAGLVPGVPIEKQARRDLLKMRSIAQGGAACEEDGPVRWGARYAGPPHVVFGHNAQREPQLHPWATGIDTGAVYGGRLTAMVLAAGEKVPPVEQRGRVLVSVRSRRVYADKRPPWFA
jgi:hypothetical protein